MHDMPIAHPDTDSPTSTTPADVATLVEEHLELVDHVVFQVAVRLPNHVDRSELARAGALGLVEAARRYDPSRGVPFGSFATRRIRGAIIDAVRASDWAPRSVRELARRLDRVEQRLAGQLGRVPTSDETAEALHVSRDELDQLRDHVFRSLVLTLDAPRAATSTDQRRSTRSPTARPPSPPRSSSAGSCTRSCTMPCRSSPSATGRSWSATSWRSARRRTWLASWASPCPGSPGCAPRRW